jgi:hypothetical protein
MLENNQNQPSQENALQGNAEKEGYFISNPTSK